MVSSYVVLFAPQLELARVMDELEDQRRAHTTQVTELKFEIDRIRKAKKEMEAKLAGVDVPKLQTQVFRIRTDECTARVFALRSGGEKGRGIEPKRAHLHLEYACMCARMRASLSGRAFAPGEPGCSRCRLDA